ncbi:hypothetical protein B9T31_00855 [Acinetobacter sp. ANC 4558]|uniref:hypothetical protein n=1 Tax=Acinetobacter sp. ANC 4558 TaxID=1977876 RepID=UPI000A3588B7|nr:hypothetical protein [Acinetobacter sp. ANC 4558]OTG88106.1 hypothetical protein B9T31_00855 [Acinetobacter sp. ANC 4558]
MKLKALSALCIIVASQVGHTAGINPVNTENITPVTKSSLLDRAAHEKKIKSNFSNTQNSKVIKSLSPVPTQNFFAYQNQQFSKFIQSIFIQTGS